MYANPHLKPPDASLFFSHNHRLHFFCRRLRPTASRRRSSRLAVCGNLSDSFQNLPSPNSLDILAPVLGLASGLTLYFSRFKPGESSSDVGEWILFTSPTPFNRFVLLRCPSISFEGSELAEEVNEKLIEQDRHFVRLSSGRILGGEKRDEKLEENLEYQRVCVGAEDGGVISIDWPANLDLKEEHGFDTTLLLVPGTPEGSLDENVRSFVCESLRRGYFPVVMNPRGCAGSPITTARLFSAADSDDISTAIQFINKARPWTTLMAVGWGYGANMLTKYLAETGETTPLTAATCINNPFDLEEATRCSPYRNALDQKLTGGMIDILRSNKELFQGRAKGFDVENALLSKSVRDFEKAISMVSYGFQEIDDFYSKSSTRGVVGNVKIPVLFIQSDDGTVPLFSIPRSLIAENPFTSLLLCSCVASGVTSSSRAAVSWCQNLTIEWLAAVELGLLKGRHPLLKDVDVTINPTKGLALVESRASNKGANKLLDLTLTGANGYTINPARDMLEENNTAGRIHLRCRQDSNSNFSLEDGLQELDNGALQQTSSIDAALIEDEAANPDDTDRGQVLQTTQVVMNILDATMPGTISEEEKKKVLTAVGQGETLMKALQDAVPEDVREKLTTAASGILHAQRTNLKLDALLGISKVSNLSTGLKSRVEEKVREIPIAYDSPKDAHPSDQMKRVDENSDGNQTRSDKSGAGVESELHPTEDSQKSSDLVQPHTSSQQGDAPSAVRKDINEVGNNPESDEVIREKAAVHSDSSERGVDTSAKSNFTSSTEQAGGTGEASVEEHKLEADGGLSQPETKKDINAQKKEEKTLDSSSNPNRMPSANTTEEALPPASESQPMERESNDNPKKEHKTLQPFLDQNTVAIPDNSPPDFNVVQALDALTGMDDSTQVAVNNVFGVIEDMISQLEEEKDEDKAKETASKVKDESIDSPSQKQHMVGDHPMQMEENNENDLNFQYDKLQDLPSYRVEENSVSQQNTETTGWLKEETTENPILFSANGTVKSKGRSSSNSRSKEGKWKDQLVGGKLSVEYINKHVNQIPLHVTPTLYRDYLHGEYFRRYLLSKMPNTKPLDLDTTTTLFLDYFPEEGQWKLLEQPGSVGEFNADVTTQNGVDRSTSVFSSAKVDNTDNYIEPSYVILDTETKHEPVGEYNRAEISNESVENGDDRLEELVQFVKIVILDALRVEVSRKLSAADMKQMESNLARDLEEVANAVSSAVECSRVGTCYLQGKASGTNFITSEKVGTLNGEHIIRAIATAVQSTRYLRRVLPIGVIVGSCLAAIRKYFNVSPRHDNSIHQMKKYGQKNKDKVIKKDMDLKPITKAVPKTGLNGSKGGERGDNNLKNINNDSIMVGAVTAALGASALLVQQQDPPKANEIVTGSSKSFKERTDHQKAADKLEESMSEKNQNNLVSSLAEKAMSVAGPVVPTKEDGEVDQERLVAMLADWGQKGGMLRLVGKIALLWGGIRGAMSLTDRLILFLRIAERSLYQRILGFAGMVLVLWSPVLVPLLPTILQSWTTNTPSRFAEIVSIIGLYTAVMILVMIWGRRIRGYEDPLEQYGLDLATPPKMQNFLKGLIGGVILVLSVHTVNALLGCMSFSRPSSVPSFSLDAKTCLKVYVQLIMVAGRGIITATGVVLVEELLFRSWLHEEIAADLGYHQGIIISGLAFALFQRSLWAIPGLWLLSLALAGFRQRSQGSLSIPIGLRAGIMASSFVLQTGGFLTYKPNLVPRWVIGTHPFQPFSGIVGLGFSLLLAIVFYPRQPLQKEKKLKR